MNFKRGAEMFGVIWYNEEKPETEVRG